MNQRRNNQIAYQTAYLTEKQAWILSPWEDKLSKITHYFRQQKHCSQIDSINRFTSTISQSNNKLISDRKEKSTKESSPIVEYNKELVGKNKLKQTFSEHRYCKDGRKQNKNELKNRIINEVGKQDLKRRKESMDANLENQQKKISLQQNKLNAKRLTGLKIDKPLRNSIPKLPKIQVFWM